METHSKNVVKVHVFLYFHHGVGEIGRGFSHDIFEEVARLKSCAQSHELGFIGGMGNCDCFAVEQCYVIVQASLRVLLNAEQIRKWALYASIEYEVAHELCAKVVKIVYGS